MPMPMQRAGEGDSHPAHRKGTNAAIVDGTVNSHCYYLRLYMHLHIPMVLRWRILLSRYRRVVPQDGYIPASYDNDQGPVCIQILTTLV